MSMDNGASSYRRFLDGDDNAIAEIVRDCKDGLILFVIKDTGETVVMSSNNWSLEKYEPERLEADGTSF